jgi:hypothetical protein
MAGMMIILSSIKTASSTSTTAIPFNIERVLLLMTLHFRLCNIQPLLVRGK